MVTSFCPYVPDRPYDGAVDAAAIVIGAGHNGLICAAYLARAGLRVLVVEAREQVGGCASTVDALNGARVNICNCDHTMIRTTGIVEELRLADHGLRYLEVEPAQLSLHWDGGPGWFLFHDIERTIESLRMSYPTEVENYRRYLKVALPMARMILDVAHTTPTPGSVLGTAMRRPLATTRAVPSLLAWGKRSVGDVVRSFFDAEQLRCPVVSTGPAVWGLSPEFPGTGLGALGYAMRHVAQVGRPVGGSGALTDAVRDAVVTAGGFIRTGAMVERILCEGERVRGVVLTTGEELLAPIVVAAGDPRHAMVSWLRDPPPAAHALVDRYRSAPQHDGYESKLDAVLAERFRYKQVDDRQLAALGLSDDELLHPTTIVSSSLAKMATGHAALAEGRVPERPILFAQVPSALDPTMATGLRPSGEIFSLEVLWTPYALAGGWDNTTEPQRWLQRFGTLVTSDNSVEPDGGGFVDSVRSFRLMGPREYEQQFHMSRGFAPAYAGTPLASLLGRSPEQTRYETPVHGLFLTGAGTFPGAGIWGASGRNAATAVLASDGRGARARRAAVAASP
jgi:phytoene dehydrogenase-like protein